MATKQDLQQNLQDLRDLGQQYIDFIKAKDALIAEKDAAIAAAVAAANISEAAKAELQAAIDEAVADSQATEDSLRAGLPGVPPVPEPTPEPPADTGGGGGTPAPEPTPEPVYMGLSYADRASFDAAAAGYAGPEAVTLDGAEVKAGTSPSLDYFSHSADGSINTTGPTD